MSRRRKTQTAGSVGGNNKPKGAELRPGEAAALPAGAPAGSRAPRPLRADPARILHVPFPPPPFFFLPSPPFLFFLPLFFFSVPPPSSLPLSLAWLDQSFGISCRRLPLAAVRPRPGAARVPCRRGSGSAGPTRVPAPVPRVSRRCGGGGGARRAERGTARGLGRPGQVRRAGHPHVPLKATSSPDSPKRSSPKCPVKANTVPPPRPKLFR